MRVGPQLRLLLTLVLALVAMMAVGHRRLTAQLAPIILYPDLQSIIPLNQFSIVQPTPTTRELRYTHHTANLGDGPLEIQPQYDATTDTARASQRLYTKSTSGIWSIASIVPLVGRFVYHPAHGHYHYPFAQFGLYQVAADGSVGASVVMSPKVGFCLGDDIVVDPSLPNFGARGYSGGFCADPTHYEGISVGYAAVYEFTD